MAMKMILKKELIKTGELKDGKTYCDKCDKDVAVNEKKIVEDRLVGTARLPYALVGDCGHVIAERGTPQDPWQKAS